MMPRWAAVSISEKPALRSAFPSATAVRAFLSALLRRDFPAVLRTLAFAACRRCFSAERMLAINYSSYLVSIPSCFSLSFASADSRELGYSWTTYWNCTIARGRRHIHLGHRGFRHGGGGSGGLGGGGGTFQIVDVALGLRELLRHPIEPEVRLLDGALGVVHLVFNLIDFRDQRGVRFQKLLGLIGNALIDALHFFLSRSRALHLRELFLQLADLTLQLLNVGGGDAAGEK